MCSKKICKAMIRVESMDMRITFRLKEIIKRRALRSNERVELLINSAGKHCGASRPFFFLLL
jgi:hypothetical protein